MVAMWRWQKRKCLSAVGRAEQPGVEHVNGVRCLGIGKDMREVPRALAIAFIRVGQNPLVAPIVGAIQAALLRFNQRIHSVGISAGNAYADASKNSVRQPAAFEALPGAATVCRFVESAARSSAI